MAAVDGCGIVFDSCGETELESEGHQRRYVTVPPLFVVMRSFYVDVRGWSYRHALPSLTVLA